ncbi:hypothetical protein DRP77_07490 [Candidatus Poribacteria bacterium]|nr:MAG: hypothetical protein DRP77_07490 [Candidatus Poribacteria bacterium]
MRELGIGVIGYGLMGKAHTYAYKVMGFHYDPPPARFKLVIVCTSREETAKRAAEHGGFRFYTADYMDVIERDDVDVVHCCVPNYLHREVVLAALRAGKHVYCEKPLATSLSEAAEMVEEVRKSGIIHRIGFQNRYSPAIMRAKMLIDEGFLGEPLSFRAGYLHPGYVDPNRPMSWRLDLRKSGGGALFDLGSHVIDLIGYLLGEYRSIFAALHTFIKRRPIAPGSNEYAEVRVDDLALLQARMKSGAMGTIEASRVATGSNDDLYLEIHGTEGAIRWSLMEPNWLYIYDARAPSEPLGGMRGFRRVETVGRYPGSRFPSPKSPIGWLRHHVECIRDFIDSIVKGELRPPTFEDGYRVQEVLEAATISSQRGQWVSLPL